MVNVLYTDTTSRTPVALMTGVSTAPDPPKPSVIVIVAGTLYPAPASATSTEVIAPPETVTLPGCACTAVAPTGEENTSTGGLMLLYPDPPLVTVTAVTSYTICSVSAAYALTVNVNELSQVVWLASNVVDPRSTAKVLKLTCPDISPVGNSSSPCGNSLNAPDSSR